MNEQEQAKQFNHALDYLMSTGEIPSDSHMQDNAQLLAIAQALAETDLSAESEQIHLIRQRLIEKAQNGAYTQGVNRIRANKALRVFAASAAAFMLMMVAVFTIPPLRIFAQDVLQQLGLLQFTNQMTIPEELAGQPANQETNITGTYPPLLTIEESRLEAGFPVYEMTYIPANYILMNRYVSIGQSGVNVHSTYTYSDESPDILTLTQWQFDSSEQEPFQWAVGSATPVEISVNGERGIYVQNAPTGSTVDDNNIYQILGVNILTWEQDGFLFVLQSFQVDLEEMLRVAESLIP